MRFDAVVTGLYLEGLCVEGDTVWVSDPIAGGIRRIGGDGTITNWLSGKKWIGALLPLGGDRILVSGEGGILWLDCGSDASGMLVEQADGRPIPGVNEMAVDPAGGLYFGSLDVAAIAGGTAPAPAAIYYLPPDGPARTVATGLAFTNGLAVSPDGRRLFLNETFVGPAAYDIAPNGSLGPKRPLLDKYDCDGMAMADDGTLWITGFATPAITCLSPEGVVVGEVPFPADGATCVRFGGADRRDLYVNTVMTAAVAKLTRGEAPDGEESVLYRTRADVPGLAPRLPAMRNA